MRSIKHSLIIAAVLLGAGMFTGCESTDGGGGSNVSGGVYYGVGLYDPWYYGGYYDGDIVVTPPDRPDRPERPVRPVQPIARPSVPSQRPTPSIPSAPRPMARPAMRR